MRLTQLATREFKQDELGALIESGRAKEVLKPGDQITVHHNTYGDIVLDVLDHDREKLTGNQKHSVTLQFHDLVLPEMVYNENGNKWHNSNIRNFLAKEEFIKGFAEEFRSLLVPVIKDNEQDEPTTDIFFLLSLDEIVEDGVQYTYYARGGSRAKRVPGENVNDWHITRSASRGNACCTWGVYTSGHVYNYGATTAWRCAPACVIAK